MLSLKILVVEYVAATDDEAVEALLLLSKTEGILPAIESSRDCRSSQTCSAIG